MSDAMRSVTICSNPEGISLSALLVKVQSYFPNVPPIAIILKPVHSLNADEIIVETHETNLPPAPA